MRLQNPAVLAGFCDLNAGRHRVMPHLATDDAEGGRGLVLVSEAASRWGYCTTPCGKVVRAEIAVPEAVPAVVPEAAPTSDGLLPRRRVVGRHDVLPLVRADPWLLQRLLTGLRAI